MSRISIKGLRKNYGNVEVLKGIDLDIEKGEFVVFVGRSGCGKSTLLRCIAGLETISEGTISIEGRDVTHRSPAARAAAGLGRSFQDARLFPDMTVTETLAVSLERWVENRSALAAALRLPMVYDDEERSLLRVDELLELMRLGDFRNSFVRELSTGTRRIVDLACQVGHRPTVILLDEPSSGIAQREVEALSPVLLRLRDEMGAALVVIEHDMPLISTISDRLIALDQGRVLASGSPAEVLLHPDVVQSYLGTDAAAVARSETRSAAATVTVTQVAHAAADTATRAASNGHAPAPRDPDPSAD